MPDEAEVIPEDASPAWAELAPIEGKKTVAVRDIVSRSASDLRFLAACASEARQQLAKAPKLKSGNSDTTHIRAFLRGLTEILERRSKVQSYTTDVMDSTVKLPPVVTLAFELMQLWPETMRPKKVAALKNPFRQARSEIRALKKDQDVASVLKITSEL